MLEYAIIPRSDGLCEEDVEGLLERHCDDPSSFDLRVNPDGSFTLLSEVEAPNVVWGIARSLARDLKATARRERRGYDKTVEEQAEGFLDRVEENPKQVFSGDCTHWWYPEKVVYRKVSSGCGVDSKVRKLATNRIIEKKLKQAEGVAEEEIKLTSSEESVARYNRRRRFDGMSEFVIVPEGGGDVVNVEDVRSRLSQLIENGAVIDLESHDGRTVNVMAYEYDPAVVQNLVESIARDLGAVAIEDRRSRRGLKKDLDDDAKGVLARVEDHADWFFNGWSVRWPSEGTEDFCFRGSDDHDAICGKMRELTWRSINEKMRKRNRGEEVVFTKNESAVDREDTRRDRAYWDNFWRDHYASADRRRRKTARRKIPGAGGNMDGIWAL